MEVATQITLFGDPALVNGISETRRLSINLDSGDYGSHSLPGTRQPTRHGPQPNWALFWPIDQGFLVCQQGDRFVNMPT